MAVVTSINTETISSKVANNNRQHFQAASEFVTKAMKRAGYKIAIALYPKAMASLPFGTKHKVKSEGGQLKLTYMPNGSGSCWEYHVKVTSKPITTRTYLDVESALLEEVRRYEDSLPAEHRPQRIEPETETITFARPAYPAPSANSLEIPESAAVQGTSLNSSQKPQPKTETPVDKPKPQSALPAQQSDQSALEALDQVMKAAVRLDLNRQEISELRKKLAVDLAENEALDKRVRDRQDKIAELELAIESDPQAKLAMSFMETMKRLTNQQ